MKSLLEKVRTFPVCVAVLTAHSVSAQGGWTDVGTVVRLASSADRVGVGTTAPASNAKLEVVQSASSSGARAIRARATAGSGSTRAVEATSSSTSGIGVYGIASAATGATFGVRGLANSSAGTGVHGVATALEGPADGVIGESDSDEGNGVVGIASSPIGEAYGVLGESDADEGAGVVGVAYAEVGSTAGVAGAAFSEDGAGVHGTAFAPTGIAVVAEHLEDGDLFVGFNSVDEVFRVEGNGDVYLDGTVNTPADFAELLPADAADAAIGPCDVLALAPSGRIVRSQTPYERAVVGVHSQKPGLLGDYLKLEPGSEIGAVLAERAEREGRRVPVAIVGIVHVKVTDENGPILPGDLLTSSSRAGHAMKCSDPVRGIGAILGKALQRHDEGAGTIRMLLMQR